MNERFSLIKRIESFKYAINGVRVLLTTQHNAWVHLFATISTILLSIYLHISRIDWIIIIMTISIVWMAEAFNTAMEFLCDATVPEIHPLIEKAKDVAAGAVFVTALMALIVGLLVFIPYSVS